MLVIPSTAELEAYVRNSIFLYLMDIDRGKTDERTQIIGGFYVGHELGFLIAEVPILLLQRGVLLQ